MYDSTPFNHDLETVRRRYRWLAPIYPLFELVFLLPRGIRIKAVERLGLTAGDKALEIGCGTGRNLCHLVAAVGPKGRVYGVDYSEAMLGRVMCASCKILKQEVGDSVTNFVALAAIGALQTAGGCLKIASALRACIDLQIFCIHRT